MVTSGEKKRRRCKSLERANKSGTLSYLRRGFAYRDPVYEEKTQIVGSRDVGMRPSRMVSVVTFRFRKSIAALRELEPTTTNHLHQDASARKTGHYARAPILEISLAEGVPRTSGAARDWGILVCSPMSVCMLSKTDPATKGEIAYGRWVLAQTTRLPENGFGGFETFYWMRALSTGSGTIVLSNVFVIEHMCMRARSGLIRKRQGV